MGARGEGVEAQFAADYTAAAASPKSEETLVKIEFDLHDPASQGFAFLDNFLSKDVNLRSQGLQIYMVPTLVRLRECTPAR